MEPSVFPDRLALPAPGGGNFPGSVASARCCPSTLFRKIRRRLWDLASRRAEIERANSRVCPKAAARAAFLRGWLLLGVALLTPPRRFTWFRSPWHGYLRYFRYLNDFVGFWR